MVSLPTYRVEPPDILQIEMLKLVPLPPYRIDIYDVLQIRVLGTILDQPIDDFYLVEGEGIVSLGPAYGTVRVVGMTIEEATEAITRKLQEVLAKPDVSVQLARTAGTQPITGQYLIAPDGTINLRQYGLLHVAGKTVTEIRADLQKHLAQYFDSPEASVDVIAYNSKVYYVITEGAGLGDNVRRRAGHRQRDGVGRLKRGQRAVAGFQRAYLDCAAGAGRFRLRADFAGGLRGDRAGRRGGHELPGVARRSGVHRRGQRDGVQQFPDEGDDADRAAVGHVVVGRVEHPRLPDPRPIVQPVAEFLA